MAAVNSTRRPGGKARKSGSPVTRTPASAAAVPSAAPFPKLPTATFGDSMQKFSEGCALLECAVKSLEDDEYRAWTVAVERAMADLREAYDGLDMYALRHHLWTEGENAAEEE